MLDYLAKKHLKNVLVVGTGGGNDIVSAVLIAEILQAHGIRVDIAGILSPRFRHLFGDKPETIVNQVTPNSRRFVIGKDSLERPFIDATLVKILQATRSKIGKVFGFSLRHGTSGLTEAVDELIQTERYDAVIGIDVGGDILGRPTDRVLSPIMDIATLTMLSAIKNTRSYLVEMGLGADGELTRNQIEQVVRELHQVGCIVTQETVEANHSAVNNFAELYYGHIVPIRAGNTGRRLLEGLAHDPRHGDKVFDYADEYRVGKQRWENVREAVMPREYLQEAFIIDPKKLAQIRAQTTPQTNNVVQLHMALKDAAPCWGSELDGQIVYSGAQWQTVNAEGESALLLTLPPNIPEPIRTEMLRNGLNMLADNTVDYCVLDKKEPLDLAKTFSTLPIGEWLVISKKPIDTELFKTLFFVR